MPIVIRRVDVKVSFVNPFRYVDLLTFTIDRAYYKYTWML